MAAWRPASRREFRATSGSVRHARPATIVLNGSTMVCADCPLAEASGEFTGRVMQGILPSGHLSLAFRIVENLAYLFAVLIVTGIMAVVFVFTGVIDSGQVSEGEGIVSTYVGARERLAGRRHCMEARPGWSGTCRPKAGKNIMVFGIGVLAGLALLDRLLHRRFVQRAR